MSRHRHPAPSMATAEMPFEEFGQWLQARADRRPVATSVPVMDGYVTAIVAGPVSMSPLDWICPLLAIDADAFNHGGTPEFAAISAVALRHNEISNILSTTPDRFEPMHRRKPNGEVDPRPWCHGFYAAMRLNMLAWAPLLDLSKITACFCPSCCTVRTMRADRSSDRHAAGRATRDFLRKAHADIPVVVEAIRQYWMPIRYARAG
jgi:uncharacterized protein